MMVKVKATLLTSRELYLDVDEDSTDEEIRTLAQQEIIYPHQAVQKMHTLLEQMGVRTNLKLDLDDWEVNNVNLIIER